MGLEYIQLFADMESLFEPYDDAQRGRLMMAMMAYAYRGEEPNFSGVEKFIWPVLRNHIDRCAQNVEAKKAAGSKGGSKKQTQKQPEAEESKAKQTEAEESKAKQNAHTHDHDNDHDHKHDQDHVVEERAREESAPTSAAVEGIDGSDLSESIRLNAEVDALLATYKLSEAVRGDLLEDIEAHGLDKVKRVMQEAARSDNRGGLSIRFIRACLASDGKPKPQRAAGTAPIGDPHMQRYSADERRKTWGAAVVDFDGEG